MLCDGDSGRLSVDHLADARRHCPESLESASANVNSICHRVCRAVVPSKSLTEFVSACVRKTVKVRSHRGATLESDPDLEMFGVPAPTNRNPIAFSRTCSSETSGMVCVFSPQTLGQPKRRHHPKLHHVVRLQQSKATPLTLLLFNPNTKVNCKSRENQGVNSWVSLK